MAQATGFTVSTNEHLIRSNLWSRQIKELLLDELNAMKFVKVLTDFPDGLILNIPSIGEAESADFSEGKAVRYNRMDTGNFVFSFDQYKYSANSISEKFKRDSFYAADVISAFVPRQHRALMEAVETRIFAQGNAGQTASNPNVINNADHRLVGSGLNRAIGLQDFAKVHYALIKANVPLTNLCCVLDPSAVYTLETQTNAVNLLSPQPQWGEIVKDAAVTGFKFRFNIFGFDVYISNYLPNGITETITPTGGSAATFTAGIANQFFSAAPGDTLTYIGGFRQMPTVYSEFNKDLQQEEFLTIAEYGFKLYRPENLVTVLTEQAVIV
jgi:hypothetical protein